MNIPTLESLKAVVAKAGYKPSSASWEDSEHIYAFSSEVHPQYYGHPQFAASYSKSTGWLIIDAQSPVCLK